MRRLLLALALVVPAAPAPGQDTLRYFNRKIGRDAEIQTVVLEDTPAKVRIRVAVGKEEDVAAGDILDLVYQQPRAGNVLPTEWRAPFNKEAAARKDGGPELLQEARDAFRTLAARLKEKETRPQRRFLEYRAALLTAALAERQPARLDEAIAAFRAFKTDYGDGWQLVPAVKALARLLEQKGDAAGAQAVYDELAATETLPKEVRQAASLLGVRYLLRTGKPTDAATKAQAIKKGLEPGDPLAARADVYLAACDLAAGRTGDVEPRLKALAAGSGDDDAKALAHNTLGDYYRGKGQNDEAFWHYLWVDVHYNQDREELGKAVYHLAKLFAEVRKDAGRARDCLDRLCDEKEFGGLEWHKKARAERGAASP